MPTTDRSEESPEQISQLLVRWSEGDRDALDELMPMVYDQLRALGRSCLAWQPQNGVLQPTVLVHEAWMRLVRQQSLSFSGRAQFFALAARIMRNILVDHFRQQQTSKRGGSQVEVPLDEAQRSGIQPQVDLLVLDEALNRLAAIKPRYAEIIELRFFGGLTNEESAEALRISHATIEREWNVARLWLQRELSR